MNQSTVSGNVSTNGPIAHVPNVRIVRKGQFLGVVAPQEWDAIQAAAQLKVVWKDDPVLSTRSRACPDVERTHPHGRRGSVQNELGVRSLPRIILDGAGRLNGCCQIAKRTRGPGRQSPPVHGHAQRCA